VVDSLQADGISIHGRSFVLCEACGYKGKREYAQGLTKLPCFPYFMYNIILLSIYSILLTLK
jgi:hypothetical protein